MDVDMALLTLGFGCAQVFITVVCILLSLYVASEAYIVGYLLVLTSCEFATTSGEKTLLASAAMFGMVVSGFFIGVFSDKYGRKFALLLTMIGSLTFSFISSLMPEVYSMAVMRFIVGCFLSTPAAVTIGYIMEFFAPKWHALAVSVQVQGIALGLFYIPAMGWAILPSHYSLRISSNIELRTWRFYMWGITLPGWLAFVGLFFVPESPYFLMYAQRMEKATKSLQWVCRLNGKKWDEMNITLTGQPAGRERGTWKESFSELVRIFKRPVLRNFLICTFYIFGIFFLSVGFGVWYPAIRNENSKESKTLCQIIEAHTVFQKSANKTKPCQDQMTNFLDPMFYALTYALMFLVVTGLVLCLPRRYVMALHVGVACLLGISLNFIQHPLGVLIAFTLMLVVPGVLIGLASSALAGCVPVELRGMALCLARSLSRLGSVVGSTLVGLLMKVSCVATLNIFVIYMAVCVVLALCLPKELRATIGLRFT
ncbi:putative transporter SVOPL isoform X2 [Drosophila serrata]|uniref:putative transporter SVOPL isoform X2 n=1 Tax=Drosophila serrata TaxID=7274 RepID=UPI000A1D078F|nr:putative transporter SVOPL isoform X2 [Drosophila serrata]XP_020814431.1 putative transporter SVOPL isoform X2 [Drosophila serrata]